MSAVLGVPAIDRRQVPLFGHALELGQAETAQLDRRVGFRHAAPLSLRWQRSTGRSMTEARTAIVTGAGERVGAAVTRGLLGDGWPVVAHGHHAIDALAQGAG